MDVLAKIYHMHDPITLSVLILILLLVAAGTAFCSFRRYEVAVFLVAISPLASAVFVGSKDSAYEEGLGSYIRISMLLFAGLVGMIQFFRLKHNVREKPPVHLILLGVFLFLALLSTSYSVDGYYTFIRSCTFIAFFGFLLGLHYWIQERSHMDKVINAIYILIIGITILSAISVVLFPERVLYWDAGNRFRGLWAHPNMMGIFCMSSYPVLLWKYERSNLSGKCMILAFVSVILVFHFFSGSRSTMLGAAFGVACWYYVLKQRGKLILLILGLCLAGGLMMSSAETSRYIVRDTKSGDSFTTLTGRKDIWHATYALIKDRPMLGYGYGVSGKIFQDARFYDSKLSLWKGSTRTSLHNGYLNIAAGTGVVGLMIWSFVVYISLRRGFFLINDTYKAFGLAIMSMCLVVNFVESSIVGANTMASIFFWVALVMLGRIQFLAQRETTSAKGLMLNAK
jgi:O-antigen ligase